MKTYIGGLFVRPVQKQEYLGFLEKLGVEYDRLTLEEVTWDSFRSLLNTASRNDYIEGTDEFLRPFKLDEIIIAILKWKVGDKNVDDPEVIRGQFTTIVPTEISNDLSGNKKETLSKYESNVKLLEKLMSYEKIGPVYAITLLFFLTCGEYPIYDQYAHYALLAICEEKYDFTSTIEKKVKDLEFHADSAKPEQVYSEYQMNYIARLKKVFGEDYKVDRRIDQALWAYGHLFNDNKTNQSKG